MDISQFWVDDFGIESSAIFVKMLLSPLAETVGQNLPPRLRAFSIY